MTHCMMIYGIVAMLFIVGCNKKKKYVTNAPPSRQSAISVRNYTQPSGISFDETSGVITIGTVVNAKDRRRFDFAFGSVTVEIIGHDNDKCVFEYTCEIEGGYTTYRCCVLISGPQVTIQIPKNGIDIKTSFGLDKCEIVRTDKMHFE